jgi:DNA-dependent RNA polymerase auxiliary subunit epsilon
MEVEMQLLFIALTLIAAGPIEDRIEAWRQEDQTLQAQLEQTPQTERLRTLALRADRDQAARSALRDVVRLGGQSEPVLLMELVGQMRQLDRENSAWLRSDIEQNGWVTIRDHGADASEDAFLLLQHATHDIEFMEMMVDPFNEMRLVGDVDPSDYALLYDRVATLTGGAQRYGTQWGCANGSAIQLGPIEDPESVDERRAEVGLGPMAARCRGS